MLNDIAAVFPSSAATRLAVPFAAPRTGTLAHA
jgi:hypothetical protein